MRCPSLHDLPSAPSAKVGWPWEEQTSRIAKGDWPKVSIVTPSYNQAAFLEETIRSVLLQGYPNYEYIIIDGGSNDGSIDIIRKYEPWLTAWISEPDRGQADAINKGFLLASGEVIAWLGSDDTYLPGAFFTQVDALARNPNCGIVYGDVLYIDRESQVIYKGYGRPYNILDLLRITIPAQPSLFMSREIWERVGELNPEYRHAMDSEYWLRAAKITDFYYEAQFVATYRLHEESKTIKEHRGFYRDWIRIADTFFNDPDLAPDYMKEQTKVYADIYARIATDEIEQGAYRNAWKYLIKSLGCRYRLRIIKIIPLIIDRVLPVKITPMLIQLWRWIHSRFR